MVERILLFKLVDSSTHKDVAELLRRELSQLTNLVHISVGLPADDASAKSWDVSCVLRFASSHELEAALASQAFQSCLEGDLQARCAVVKAWSFAQI